MSLIEHLLNRFTQTRRPIHRLSPHYLRRAAERKTGGGLRRHRLVILLVIPRLQNGLRRKPSGRFPVKNKRRAGDSNPQPLAGHLISSQTMMVKQVPNTLRIARSDATGKRDSALVGQQGSSFLDSSLDTWFQTPTVAFFAVAEQGPPELKESLPVRGRAMWP